MNDELRQLRSPLYSFLRCWVMFMNFAEMGKLRHLCVSAKSADKWHHPKNHAMIGHPVVQEIAQ